MNAEELLLNLKQYIETLDIDGEVIITPTIGDPTELQNDVTLLILENVEEGRIPRFSINVKDLEPTRG